jgi:Icc-related predicted phosphoesterase
MKIKIVSDLHLEFSDVEITNSENADLLILAGDIVVADFLHKFPDDLIYHSDNVSLHKSPNHTFAIQFRNFLQKCSDRFANVIYVMGNHEFYHGKFFESIQYMRQECARYPNIHMLEQNTKIINDVVFVGGTLWTNLNKGDPIACHTASSMMNDYSQIRNDKRNYARLSPDDTMRRHRETLSYFKTVLDQNQTKQCVVVGHHAPCALSIAPAYVTTHNLNDSYYSNLTEFILDRPQISLWVHGHMHNVSDYMIGSTRVVCNPRGYVSDTISQNTGWNPNLIVTVN